VSPVLEDHYGVPVIVCSLDLPPRPADREPEDARVHFSLQISGKPIYDEFVSAAEMKLPPDLAGVERKRGVRKLILPKRVLEGLGAELNDHAPGMPVWLRLGSPAGHLPAVPWEWLLQGGLGVPVLRLPDVALSAVGSGPPLEVVVCACRAQESAPYDVDVLLARFIDELSRSGVDPIRIQVFTDDGGERDRLRGSSDAVVVHDPPDRVSGLDPKVTPIENAWLRWIVEALGGSSVDIVHFITPGQLSSTYGALKLDVPFSEGPEETWPIVQAAELAAFLTLVGASAVGFTIPTVAAWPAGIRILAHRVMAELTGPVLVDAPHQQKETAGIGPAYRLLFGTPPVEVPSSTGVAIYVHPKRVYEALLASPRSAGARAFEARAVELVQDLTLATGPIDDHTKSGTEPPMWLAANQRTLELWASELLAPHVESEYRSAFNEGVADALSSIKDVLDKHGDPTDDELGGPGKW
jgi:hypothetical protein